MGVPRCRLSIVRNGNVHCRYFLNFPVDFKIVLCRLLILRKFNDNVPCCYSVNFNVYSSMSTVKFKKTPCRPVDFKGQGPH